MALGEQHSPVQQQRWGNWEAGWASRVTSGRTAPGARRGLMLQLPFIPAVDESSLYLLNELPPGSSSCTPSHHGSSVHVCSAIPRPRDSLVCHYSFYCFFFSASKKKAQRYSWGQKSTQRQCWSFQAEMRSIRPEMYTTKHLHRADRLSVTPSEPTLANQNKIRAAYSPR